MRALPPLVRLLGRDDLFTSPRWCVLIVFCAAAAMGARGGREVRLERGGEIEETLGRATLGSIESWE